MQNFLSWHIYPAPNWALSPGTSSKIGRVGADNSVIRSWTYSFEASTKITAPILLQWLLFRDLILWPRPSKQDPSRPVCGKQDMTTIMMKQRPSSTTSLLLNNLRWNAPERKVPPHRYPLCPVKSLASFCTQELLEMFYASGMAGKFKTYPFIVCMWWPPFCRSCNVLP